MPKKFYANGVTGQVAIYEGGYEAAFTNPLANLDKVYFHSDLDYVAVSNIWTGSITHTARTKASSSDSKGGATNAPTTGTVNHVLATFPDLGYVRHAVLVVNNEQLPASYPVQTAGTSGRVVFLRMTATQAVLEERWYTFATDLPAISVTYKLYVFTGVLAPSGTKTLEITPSSMIASRGKLNTAYRYIRSKPSSPEFYLIRGKTADVQGGGLRVVTPAGTTINDGIYTGSFTGHTAKGVTI